MNRIFGIVLSFLLIVGLTNSVDAAANLKIGVILVGDETEGYTEAHIKGITDAAKDLGIAENQIVWKTRVTEDSTCYETANDLAKQGCNLIISNSYGHQTFIAKAAEKNPNQTFVAVTGDFAKVSGLKNFKNAFTNVYESRYVSGVVAGMKLKELLNSGALNKTSQPESFTSDGKVKVGYIGAFNYAEVVSGYTAFYLGIKSIVPDVVMEVVYTNSWFDPDKEAVAARDLVSSGAVIIGQHADSAGSPSAIQELLKSEKICYAVGYNVDMRDAAPDAILTSATNNWKVYYKYLFAAMMNGKKVKTDWAEGYSQGAVGITALGKSCAIGTAEKVAEIESQISSGKLKIFDTNSFTVNGQRLNSAEVDLSFMDWSKNPPSVIYKGKKINAIKDGYFAESFYRSAPYFSLRIDGIIER